MLQALLLHTLLVLAPLLRPTPFQELAGEWRGKADIPGMPIEFLLSIGGDEAGEPRGTIDIPAQGAKGLALGHFSKADGKWRFSIEGVPGEPTFSGALSDDGTRFSGEFSQGGMRFPFALERIDRAAALDAARARLAGLDAWMEKALAEWKTPGLALAVVNADGLVLARGFGLRDRERALPVGENTLFAIGSSTKAFTAAVLGDLVEEGLVEWDRPVRSYLPDFELQEEHATMNLTVRDMLAHRSGLPRHDLAWYGAADSREELFRRLRHLDFSAGFRERFQYQNLMYMTAGLLAGRVAGSSWEELLEQRFLRPLGMQRSVLSIAAMSAVEDRALAYQEEEGELTLVPYRVIDAMGPAGSINSSAADMARWLGFLLGRGELEGTRILEESTFDELLAPVTVMPRSPLQLEHEGQGTYALGWMVQDYRGRERLHHGGGIDGFTALVSFLPRDRVAVVALANRGGSSLPTLATYWVLDRMLELEPIDWSALLRPVVEAAEKQARDQQQESSGDRREGTSPAHPLADYAGEYEHEGYGRIDVRREGDGLRFSYHSFDEALEHWHFDTFRISKGAAKGTLLHFRTDRTGAVAELEAALEPSVPPIVFRRSPPAELQDLSVLRALAGTYTLGAARISVALRGKNLSVQVPGQPAYKLLPWREREFRLAGLEGYSLRYELTNGRCERITFVQPNGNFTAERASD